MPGPGRRIPPVEAGLGDKPLLWRIGAWLVTFAVLLVLLHRVSWAVLSLLVALLLSLPYAYTRMQGRMYTDDAGPTVERLGVLALFMYLVFWRAPVLIGDLVLTPFWNLVARIADADRRRPLWAVGARARRPARRRQAVVLPPDEDEPTWPPAGVEEEYRPTAPATGMMDWDLAGRRAAYESRHDQKDARDWARRILRGHW